MKVLVLGNGFDLNFNLPTSYICFLKTTMNLSKKGILMNDDTIGGIFGRFKNDCSDIKRSLDSYEEIYNKKIIKLDFLIHYSMRCENNMWWRYFTENFEKNIGWIDFEKEIKNVLSAFENFFKINKEKKVTYYATFDVMCKKYLCSFDFFYDKSLYEISDKKQVLSEYLIPHSIFNGAFILNKKKIAERLFEELVEFIDILREYFRVFVDDTLDDIIGSKYFKYDSRFEKNDFIVSFNYTNSFEKIYKETSVSHIHGKTSDQIVLGIGADVYDEKQMDTTFIQFKKYYQRVIWKTDLQYLEALNQLEENRSLGESIDLTVFGHSLDITDSEIIEELFNVSDKITILCHKEEMIPIYFKNLVTIFGKKEIDKMRLKKNLTFECNKDVEITKKQMER